MELFTLVVILAVFAETSFLMFGKRKPTRSGRRKIYVDTSVLIDGRILNIARTGFIDGDLIILKSVLLELQLLADGKDSEKRSRARAGLEVAAELERVINVNTVILDEKAKHKKVDEELLRLAKENRGAVLTLDYNLIKVAEAEKIPTLNINDLALAVRSEFLPGEKIKLKILEKGSNRGQGLGYLDDGTMVVVDRAANKIGKELTVEFVKFHETSSGKMIFAKIAKR
ncbi:TRAM domain-containing protein [Candidatus Saccharibacteria bacterium]|nr:TRAM domain-containing protein [Candidatus Saccharibacteria bacterium]